MYKKQLRIHMYDEEGGVKDGRISRGGYWKMIRYRGEQPHYNCTMPKMRECISIHIGQAGVQMGNACWYVSQSIIYHYIPLNINYHRVIQF